ncbi:MAG: AIR carboxylase family protein [Anaerolineae bacterium]|nr:AIR carboxylase family protein [Anaerolineae bacterium]MDW8067395.1 AIR carboxylase family protein [Anaerolineae bacterium]
MRVILLMGSGSDLPVAEEICRVLDRFGVPWERRVASAHKSIRYLLSLLEAWEADQQPKVYITIAGRSNALSGVVDASVAAPVIACPPYSDRFAGADLFSSLRMPSGVAPGVVLEPEAAALLAVKILALGDPGLQQRVREYQAELTGQVLAADEKLRATS